jgi:geranylgeranyl pyrophosphate synthase
MIHALSCASPATAKALRSALTEGAAPERNLVCQRLNETGSIDYAVAAAREHTTKAIGELNRLSPSDACASLSAMTEFVVDRHF